MGGSGEKEIETDRRIIRDQITVLEKKLEKIDKQGVTRRKSRANVARVALVGYTNVGKSTLMNLISKEKIYAKDELFATVDSTVRKVVINTIPFLLSDTVGFIRKLPHDLIESFKSTLDEVREADILLHVVDVSHPGYEEHMQVVEDTLAELKVTGKKVITVYNN
jgi:GTP-binding protein HflX